MKNLANKIALDTINSFSSLDLTGNYMWEELIRALLDLFSVISVTILTILIPVYVIAFSLVGPSAGRRKEEIERIKAQEEQANQDAIEETKELLEKDDTSEAHRKLSDLVQQKRDIEEERLSTEKRYSALGLKQALLYPSVLLIITAASFKAVTVIYKDYGSFPSLIVFTAGLVALIIAVRFIVNTLSLVEELGKFVTEYKRQELRNVLKEVIHDYDKTKSDGSTHTIDFSWKEDPPFEIADNEELQLDYSISLTGGFVANDVSVLFLIPPGFEYVGASSWKQSEDRGTIANYVTTRKKFGKISKKINSLSKITIISKENKPGSYKAYYEVYSDEYVTDKRVEFEIVVK